MTCPYDITTHMYTGDNDSDSHGSHEHSNSQDNMNSDDSDSGQCSSYSFMLIHSVYFT